MGNLCSRIFNSSQSWTTSQLVFGLVWPAVVVWFIMKVLVEKVYSGPHANALAEFKTQRANGFESFKQKSDPANPAVLDKIYPKGPRGTEVETVEMYHKILKLDFEKLRVSLQNDEYRAITVMCAFVWRAMKINKELNCITQVITDAFDKAIKLDQEFYKTGKAKGPLHGLPFSVKSNFNVAGYPVTVGLAKLLGENKAATCPMVQFLCDLGAVPFCLTNVPQGLLSYITSNPIYGTTRNPWDLDRTPGGSSGGEAALLAAGGAAFGTGSDLAGSLRIPAAFCGLVTLKPTQDRLVTTGTHGGLPGRGRLGLSFGFYTHTVTDQHYLLDLIIGSPEYRRLCPMSSPARLQELPEKQKLRIGYFVDDGFHASVPSSRRAVEETIEKLKNQGHECVLFEMDKIEMQLKENGDWRVFGPNQFADMLFRNVMPDNGAYMANNIYKGETYDEHMKAFIRTIAAKQNLVIGGCIRVLTLLTPFFSKPLSVLAKARNAGLADMRQNQENTDYFKECWLRYWNGLGIDALICPSFITPAQEFEYPTKLSTGAFLTGLFNMLDVPAGVVPVGYVSKEDIEDLQNPEIFNVNGDALLWMQKKTCLDTEGLPTAVQVVTLPNEEEMCLRVMQMVEESTKGVKKLQWSFDPAQGTEESGKEKSKRLFKRVSLFEQ